MTLANVWTLLAFTWDVGIDVNVRSPVTIVALTGKSLVTATTWVWEPSPWPMELVPCVRLMPKMLSNGAAVRWSDLIAVAVYTLVAYMVVKAVKIAASTDDDRLV